MAATAPNVLLVIVDQWAGALLGCAGHPTIQTPTLDQLARNGVRFTRAYSESPICIPARRSLYTGTSPRTHGDRVFRKAGTMPALPTVAGCFRDAGYQALCVGKLHVYPERDRIGYDDVLLAEEGRPHLAIDDHDLYLADHGFTGMGFTHGMANNSYMHRPWHLPEHCHVTNWATAQMCRAIKRRDPTRPAFWTLSYPTPHPPLVPLAAYMESYRQLSIEQPLTAPWAEAGDLPHALKAVRNYWPRLGGAALADMRRAFYALCTHIDHQLRVVLGTLREERLLDDTIVAFCSDHGDMLGDFGLYAKRLFYEGSARIPLIVMGPQGDRRLPPGSTDDRLVCLQDVMPTLLDLAGVAIPDSCDGISAIRREKRTYLYGEVLENHNATRMLRDARHKLIWYPAGNRIQLFDLETDPDETNDVADDSGYATIRTTLASELATRLYGKDVDAGWTRDGVLVGYDPGPYVPKPDRSFTAQRGLHYPPPPSGTVADSVGFPE
jgi:arylsulfatase A-like enzyme